MDEHIPRDIIQIKQKQKAKNIKQFPASESCDSMLYDGGNGCCLTFANIWALFFIFVTTNFGMLEQKWHSVIQIRNDNETDDRARMKDVDGTVQQICNIMNDRSEEEIK